MSTIYCPVAADHEESKLILQLAGERQIRRCIICNVVFTYPTPSVEETAAFYQGFAFGMPDHAAKISHAQIIHDNVRRVVDDLRSAGAQMGSLLDLGGSLGFYANAFANYFTSVDLCDVDRDALEYASHEFPGRFGIRLASPAEIPKLERTYDVIFANQVIEHCTDLGQFFATLHHAANDDSLVVITTPNHASRNIWLRPDMLLHYVRLGTFGDRWTILRNVIQLIRDPWATCDPPRHVLAFDPKNLRWAAEHHGFEVVALTSKYCTDDYYSPAKYGAVPLRDVRSLSLRAAHAFIRTVLRTKAFFDTESMHGDDLVLFCRPARGSHRQFVSRWT